MRINVIIIRGNEFTLKSVSMWDDGNHFPDLARWLVQAMDGGIVGDAEAKTLTRCI